MLSQPSEASWIVFLLLLAFFTSVNVYLLACYFVHKCVVYMWLIVTYYNNDSNKTWHHPICSFYLSHNFMVPALAI